MPTSKLDRLNKLFEGRERIARPDPTKTHISDLDFAPKTAPTEQLSVIGLAAETPWKVPETAQYPRQFAPPLRESAKPGRAGDMISSSESDEYLAVFSSRPAMKNAPVKMLKHGKPKDELEDDVARSPGDATVANDLPVEDVEGNRSTGHFCPLVLVAKFPYKYMVDTNDRVSKHFFAANRFYERRWHIYYIDPPGSLNAKPMLLLPLSQVQQLIDEINKAFKSNIECPPHPFVLTFFEDGTPQPKSLGTSHCKDDISNMEDKIPSVPNHYGEIPDAHYSGPAPPTNASFSTEVPKPVERNFVEFKAKMERALAATKKGKHIAKKKKNDDRFLRQQDWARQLKRAQRYFALRPKAKAMPLPDSATSWAEQQQRYQQNLLECGILLEPLDVNKAAPHPFERDAVFVCVDVEAYERDSRKITEIGVSTLDTMDMAGLAPGQGGDNWIARIRSRHFRIRGRGHLENKDFCPGDANNFQFGTSEWVDLERAAETIDQCFEYPYSTQFKPRSEENLPAGPTSDTKSRASLNAKADPIDKINIIDPDNAAQDAANQATVSHIIGADLAHTVDAHGECIQAQCGSKKRNVIFVGHDIRNEFEYLRTLGSQIFGPNRSGNSNPVLESNASGIGANGHSITENGDSHFADMWTGRSETLNSIIEALDTAILYRVLVKETQNSSLGKVILGLGRTAWHLHNAGNDARYTLEALIGICIKARLDEDQTIVTASGQVAKIENPTQDAWTEEVKARVSEKAKAAEQDVRDECADWGKATKTPHELAREMHTMTVTNKDGVEVECDDPWLMAQMSGNEDSERGKENEQFRNVISATENAKTVVYRDPAFTGGEYQQIKTDNLDGGDAEVGGLAKLVDGGKKKKSSRRTGL